MPTNFRLTIFASVFLIFSLLHVNCSHLQPYGKSSKPSVSFPISNSFNSHSDESAPVYGGLNSNLNVPLINSGFDSENKCLDIKNIDWKADVPAGKIKAGALILSVSFLFNFVIKSTDILSIIAEIGLSGALIYLLQFYFGYLIRLRPMGFEKMQFNRESGVSTFFCWTILIPSSWINLSAFLYIPGYFFPLFFALFFSQLVLIFISIYGLNWMNYQHFVSNVSNTENI